MTKMLRAEEIGKFGDPYNVRCVDGFVSLVRTLSQSWNEQQTFCVIALLYLFFECQVHGLPINMNVNWCKRPDAAVPAMSYFE